MYDSVRSMTPKKAAAYFVVALLGVGWVASAISVSRQSRPSRRAQPPSEAVRLDSLATDVQAQASRLRQRLASAPSPQTPTRNPFVFASRAPAPERRPLRVEAPLAVEPLPEPEPPEPPLVLIGVAERRTDKGIIRTAMIAGEGDALHMVTEGEEAAGYLVVAVSPDAVELKHPITGATRRLGLK
jgi:hypothetical protein